MSTGKGKDPDKVLAGRKGGLMRAAAAGDPREAIKPARQGWDNRFDRAAEKLHAERHPGVPLTDDEKARIADQLKRAYMTDLARKRRATRPKPKSKGQSAA